MDCSKKKQIILCIASVMKSWPLSFIVLVYNCFPFNVAFVGNFAWLLLCDWFRFVCLFACLQNDKCKSYGWICMNMSTGDSDSDPGFFFYRISTIEK